jgi:hypothetical protein
LGFHTSDSAALLVGQDASDSGIRPEFNTELTSQFHERRGDRAGSAARVPDAFLRLHMRDRTQYRGRLLGGGTDVLSEVIEHLGDAWIAIELSHGA